MTNELQQIIDFCEKEMKKVEGEKFYVVINANVNHLFDVGVKVKRIDSKLKDGRYADYQDETGMIQSLGSYEVEERQHLGADYFAFEKVKNECERLIKKEEIKA